MEMMDRIRNAMQKNGGIMAADQLLSLGISKTTLANYARGMELERLGGGLYLLPGYVLDDLYALMLRSDRIIFSHETALFLNGLSERTPFIHAVTIPNNASLPSSMRNVCACYYVKPELHEMGLTERQTTFGHTVRCYNAERTICDLLRSRSRYSTETIIGAMKAYAESPKKRLDRLSEYAEKLRVRKALTPYMEALL